MRHAPADGPPTLDDLDLEGRAVLLRLDLNVPMQAGQITSTARIAAGLPAIQALLAAGGRVAVASHLGRPRGAPDDQARLLPVGEALQAMLGTEVIVAEECIGEGVLALVRGLRPGQLALLENLRFHPGEEANAPDFARALAAPFDTFVNDAFGASHRAHASIVGVPALVQARAVGPLMGREVAALSRLLTAAARPFVAVVGGAKVSDKLGVIESLLSRADSLLIGGAMAFTFLAALGTEVGNSRVETDRLREAKEILARARARGVEILLPVDHVAAATFAAEAPPAHIAAASLPSGQMGLDIGPATRAAFAARLARAETIFWNGPMGVFEWPSFAAGTLAVARAVADSRAFSVVGGGDSVAAVEQAGVADAVGHLCTGGGASLEFLERGRLPGIEALGRRDRRP